MFEDAIVHVPIKLTLEDKQIMALSIFGATDEQVGSIMINDACKGKKLRWKLREKLGYKTSPEMVYEALRMGFDTEGCYKRQPLFTREMEKRIRKVIPRVHAIKTIPPNPKKEL